MRSRNSREAFSTNNSGGSHGRSRWQSAEIRRYRMAPSAIDVLPQCKVDCAEQRSLFWHAWMRLRRAPAETATLGVFQDHVGAFLADHDRRGVGVAAGHLGH